MLPELPRLVHQALTRPDPALLQAQIDDLRLALARQQRWFLLFSGLLAALFAAIAFFG